jgi:hypothetical protein
MLETISGSATEGDVETQIVVPLFTRSEYLGFDLGNIKSKEFLAAFDIGKGSKQKKGYIPDYCIYILSLPIVAVEVKAPSVGITEAWEEASLYAHALNKRFSTSLNPCQYVFATNGIVYAAGKWDQSKPTLSGMITQISVGSEALAALQSLLGADQLTRYAGIVSASLKLVNFKRPFNQDTGPSLVLSKLEPNTFAADLSPILRRYFSSRDQNRDPEIYKNAYVSSNEITSYDKILESFLTDRLSRSKTRTEIKTTKKRAEEVSKRISALVASRPQSGELQLITGGVGTGKSLFARRYKEFLQPASLRDSTHWSFLDFNFAPDDLSDANEWVYNSFVKSLLEEGAPVNPRDEDDQERIFADDLAGRERIEEGRGELERARDIEAWRQDPERLAHGMSRHLQGDRGEVIIVVFDNVDRRDVENQLAAFQLALWFMEQMRCIVILQMRDVTFEAHKNDRPLDTYKTGQVFHISPPRFIDVVKRRLELSLADLAAQAPEVIKYRTPSGIAISYPKDRAGEFLKGIYLELFSKPTNTSRILEGLAGRNVRKALDMFMAIITSGHTPEDLITNVASGQEITTFPESLVLKILMRQDYRFFSDTSGFVSNIFYVDRNWQRPSNLLVPECLFYLINQRKIYGENGQLGFVSVARLQGALEKVGFVRSDVFSAVQYLLGKELIEADSSTASTLSDSDSIKASASGWAHLRIICSRAEYVWGVLPTTGINDRVLEARVFDLMQTEGRFNKLYPNQVLGVVEHFHRYLQNQFSALRAHPGYTTTGASGSAYVIHKIAEALRFERNQTSVVTHEDWLDG